MAEDDIDLRKEYEKLPPEPERKIEKPIDPFADKKPEDSIKKLFKIKDLEALTSKIMEDSEEERRKLVKEGYIPGILLDQYIFTGKILKRARAMYDLHYEDRLKKGFSYDEEDYGEFGNISEVANQYTRLQSAIDAQREKSQIGMDIHTLHQKEIEENAKYIQSHIGSYSFLCQNCRSVVSSGGLPSWAIKTQKRSGEIVYHIWSEELAWAVKKGLIPIHLMAFALITSPEGLLHTANERSEKLPPFNIEEEEKKLRKILDEYEK